MRLGSLSEAKQSLIRGPLPNREAFRHRDSGILAAHKSAQNQRKTEVLHSPTVSRHLGHLLPRASTWFGRKDLARREESVHEQLTTVSLEAKSFAASTLRWQIRSDS